PVALQGDSARIAAVRTDVGFVRDADVRRLAGFRKCRRFIAHRWQCDPRLRRNQETPDLALDLVVASLADPAAHESPTIVEEVLRRPGIIPERAPDGKTVVDGDRVRHPMIADFSVD